MGTGGGMRIPLWISILALAFIQIKVQAQNDEAEIKTNYLSSSVLQGQKYFSPASKSQGVKIIQPMPNTLKVKAGNPSHNGRVCSTWGNFHFKNFDGDIFYFPGVCNYIFTSNCKSPYEDFNIQIRRKMVANATMITHVIMKLEGAVIELRRGSVLLDGKPVQMPYSHMGVLIEKSNNYLKVSAKLGLTCLWNEEDALLVELEKKFANQTCGLCGDFNGIPTFSEFYSGKSKLTHIQFGNKQKMDGPTEQCADPILPAIPTNCSAEFASICETVLTSKAFTSCNALVNVQDYIETCIQDLCHCDRSMADFCMCNTFAEYSRQCAHAGGQPLNWRTSELCPKSCPFNMQYHECGSPCSDTCSNPERSQLCEDHCTDGCVCPPGTVFDDITGAGCIPRRQCHCTYEDEVYAPGAAFSSKCRSCTCLGGEWSCVSQSCPGTCSIEGGSHISTFDEKHYSFFGDCSYVLTKLCDSNEFTVLGDIHKCGLSDTETCLKGVAVSLSGGQTNIVIQPSGSVFVNMIYTQLPFSAANVTIFRPTSFFIILQTNFGLQLQIQLMPLMQVFIDLDPTHKGQTCGLCGNFNDVQTDDFKTTSGVIEGTSAAFGNTWKIRADCADAKNTFEDPCTLSVQNEQYAQHWCGLLSDTSGPFAECHSTVNPEVYEKNCMFDTCNCEKSEDCMCAALSSYARACAAKGVLITGWRTKACSKYTNLCPKSLKYTYSVSSCQPTCRSLSEPDVTCNVKFVPVDGCTCMNGTYMDESGKCVSASSCPCYYKGTPLSSGEVIHDNGVVCTCTYGKLSCSGEKPEPVCRPPMVYIDCGNATTDVVGAGCQKSCQTLDMECYKTRCVSGCVCPHNLVLDGKGGCIAPDDCPCVHNGNFYSPGESIRVGCNNCTCRNRKWHCSHEPCLETCSVYGDGHYTTFDGKRFDFEGDCEYVLVQNYCGQQSMNHGTFRVITENIPCGTTGTTCSKAIKVFLQNYELLLSDGHSDVIQRTPGGKMPFQIRSMGIYTVVDTTIGVILMWDKKTSIFIKLTPSFQGHVCGLCGNYDGNGNNDFTTRSQSVVGNVLEFANSWKVSSSCPNANRTKDPCTANPYRKAWAQKQCSIITSSVFAKCHSQIEPNEYYQACVDDACACDTGGDCECFCTAVAAYAQACNELDICISWRTPSICPLFCDYYNPQGECEWHYKPCGAPCMKTCKNPSGKCLHELRGLEGCYPNCPKNKPYFDEETMTCVSNCGCYEDGKMYKPGMRMPSKENCQSCECTNHGKKCRYDQYECVCIYEGKKFVYKDVVYNTTDGTGGCIVAVCGPNGTLERIVYDCPSSTTPTVGTTFHFSTTTPATTSTVSPTTSVCVHEVCEWSQWYDGSQQTPGYDGGDFETFNDLRSKGYEVCKAPRAVQCRAEKFPDIPLKDLGQKVECSTTAGLICYNKDQISTMCNNYEIRILCCVFVPCSSTTSTTTKSTIMSSTTEEITPFSTTTQLPTTESTTYIPTQHSSTTTTEIPPVTTSHSTHSLCVKEECYWSMWYDASYPGSGYDDGDFDTVQNIRKKGYKVCENRQAVECRAVRFPDTPYQLLEQHITCNKEEGLVCYNKDQLPPICYNYEIRFKCCEYITVPCETTTLRTTSTEVTTPFIQTKHPTTTQSTKPPETEHIHSRPTTQPSTRTMTTTTSICEPICHWSEWLDVDFPSAGPNQGDFETYQHIRAAGKQVCQHPRDIQCQAENFPELSIQQVGQVVQCDVNVGLVCKNKDQTGKYKMCLNYKIRVLCCVPNPNCQPTTTLPTPSTTMSTSTPVTTYTTSPSSSETTSTTYTSTTSPTPTPTVTTSISTTTSICEPICHWSEWLDVDFPSAGPNQGDFETYQHIRAAGKQVCQHPRDIQCQAENFPELSIQQVGQVVQCDVNVGLVCKNKDQTGKYKMCLNYKIRVLCCVPNPNCQPTTTLPTPSTTMSTSTPVTTYTTSPSSSETTSTTYTSTTSPTPTPTVTTSISTTTSICEPICHWSEWLDVDFPSAGPNQGDFETYQHIRAAGKQVCQHPRDIQCQAENFPELSIQQVGQVVQCDVNVGLVCKNKDQTGKYKMCLNYKIRVLCCVPNPNCQPTTTLPTPSTTMSTSTPVTTYTTSPSSSETTSTTYTSTTSPTPTPTVTTSISTTTSICEPICHWSEWLDVDFPSAGPNQGDFETYQHIRAAGKQVCQHPRDIQCQAENFPELSIQQVGQVVQCDVNVGLVCKNKDQTGKYKMCLNYKIRVLCCVPNPNCQPTTTLPTPSTTMSTSTPVTTYTTSPSSSETTSTTYTSTTSPTPTPTVTTSISTTTSICEPICHWSEWLDVDFPSAGPNQGDFETYQHIRAAGKQVCQHPRDIQCQAENFPELSIQQVGQVVQCDVNVGLVCKNKDQTGKYKMCLNYKIRVLCCVPNPNCQPTTTLPTPSTTMSTSTPVTTYTTSPSSSETTSTTYTSTTSPTPTPTVTTSISTTTSICEPICHWSEWLDVDFPSAGPNQGDFETYQHIRAAGKQVCQHPRDIQCQAENFPELSIQQVGQVVQCDVNVGLVCKNKDQTGKYKMCLNYKIRVLCCVPNPNCQPTTTLPTPSTTMSTSTPVTTYTTSPSSSETTSTTYTSTTSPTPTPTVTTSISTTTSICEPICHWSEWLDVDFPSAGPNQGDFETYQHIRAAGKQVCQHPRDIQCQAENFPELSIQQVGQVVQCDVNVGLVCKNKDQTGKYKMCLNYKIRVLCCVPNPNCQPTTTLPTPSTTMSTSTPVTTYTTSPSSSETTSTTYTSTTSPTPTPTVTTSISTTTSICEPICHWSEWLDVDFPSAGPNQGDFETYQHIRAAGKQVCQHPRDIQCQAENFPELSIQQVGQVVQCDVNVGLVCKNKDQTGKYKMCLNYKIRVLCCVPNPNCQPTTTLPTPSTTMSTSTPVTTYTTSPSSSETTSTTYTSTTSPTPTPTVTTSISTTTSICEPICHWSEWLDVDFPSAGPNQGDFETYQHIRAAGKQVCQHPRDIQCQAENFPELSIQQVGQVVQCDVNVGLVCKNKDQTGKYKMCLNYKIRVLCCVPNPNCQPTTTLPTPSTTMSTSTPVTTYTTSPSSSETTSTTYTSTTSPTPTPTVTTSISTTTSICEPICHWSEWLDVDFPSAGPNQGDFETYQHIRAAGKQVCQHPRDIQCQAENFPELSIQQVGQVVQCDVNVGLVCKNKDQTGKYKMCLNYKIRVLCCVPNPNCQPTTTLPTPSTTMSTSTPVTTYTTSPSSSETTSTTYTSTTSPTPTPTVTTSISTTTSICEPICHWSEWLDVDFPSAGPNQGDFETYQHIRAAGKQVCQHPRDIQCQAENFPELSIQQVGQVVQCDVNVGLVCKNKDQTGKYKMCLNYKIRVLCCVPNPNCQPTTTLPTPSTTMSTSTPVTTYTTSPSSSETTSTTYTSTTSPTPTPTVTTSISTTTSICEPICHWSEWLDVDFPSAGPNQGDFETYQHIRAAGKQVCQHPRDIQCQAENFPELSIQQVGQVVQCDVNVGLVCKNKDQTGKYKMCLNYKIRVLCCVPNPNCQPTTTLPTPSTTMSTSTPVTTYTMSPSSSETTSTTYTSTTSPTPTPTVTTSISTTTSICEPICHWSEWLDVDFPSAGPNQGDFETYQHIRAAGKQVCQHPRDIQCQAENFPELSIQQVGQVVQCDVNVGLVCKNKDQTGKYKMCLNYKIRVLCCVPNPNCQPTTTLPTPSTTMSTSTPVTTYTTSPSSSETTSTTYTSTTSPTPTPTVTTSISTTTSICEPICHWSEWLDVDFPSAGPNQGDFETYQHIRAAGKQVCQHPRDIQCQAENFPELSIQQVGQVVQCDVNVGLVCKNKDQTGKYKMCLNYKIRVLCCVPNPNCQPTTTLPTPSTTMSTSTPVTTYTTSPSSSETTSTTYTSTTSPTPTPTVTTSISTTTSICEPICHWSEWLDVDFPSAGPNQGDFETYQHIRAAGKQVCQHPRDIQCQAENFPELSIQQVGQVVQCDVNVGLVCKNKDQTGKYKMCLNYKIRVLCCVPNPNCQPTTTLPTPSTTMSTSTPVTTYTTSPSSSETTSTTYTSTTSPTPTPTVTTSISTTTSICEPICHWSEWLDVDFPSAGPNQGDFETYQHIRAAGKQVCQHPRDIQCQAENFPELSIQQVGQVVQCDVNVGLVCKNKDQTGKYKMCLNYKIRVLCCVPNPNCQPTTTLPTPSTTMSTSTPVTTYTTSPSSSETTSTTYTSTTSPTPTPTVTTSISTTTSICEPICHWSEWLDVDFPSAGPNQGDFETYQHIRAAGKQVCQHPRDIQCQAENFPELSIQQVGQVVQCDVNVGLVCKNKDQTGKYKMCLNYKIRVLCCVPNPNCQPTTTLPTPSTTMSTSTPVTTYTTSPSSSETTSTTYTSTTSPTPTPTVTTSISTTTSICEPICHWSEWLDVDFPSAGPNQGDFETYQHIRAAGKQVCQHPRDIQCQAENFPELSIQQVGQVVQCDVNVGLVCKNKDQTGKYKMCLNYKIRVLCCVPNPNCQPTTTLPTPSTTMSTSTPVTTYTTSPSSSETTSTTYTSTTSPTPTPTVTTSISTTTSICEPICHWSEWLDVDFPSAGPNQGDFETYQHIRAAGKQVCQHPRDIQCQAENFPELSIQQVGQVVQCDVNVGLVCKNKDQTGKYKMCLNYKIRVLCCVPNPNCQPTTTLPTPSTTMSTSTPVTTYTTSPSSSETTSTTYTSTTSPTPTPTVTTSISTTTSICEPICHWSEWLDVDFPSAGPNQGDFETYQHIRAAGKQVCQHPRDIQCQAENFPELSIQQVGQVVQCDVNVGLVCKNKDQTGKYKMCLNYKIRVLCCVPNPNCQPTTTLPTPSTTMSTSTPVTTYTTSPSSSETTSTTYTSTTSPTPTPTVTTSISTTTSICEPICHWSEWLDVDFPSAGPNQGDFETYQHIRAAGKQVCQHPRDIQCQAENFPELSIQQVGQVVQCDVNVGLVCKNKDQTGKYKMCLNYKIRVLCCVPNPNCQPTTTLPTPSTTMSTSTPVTTYTTSPSSSETTSTTYTSTTSPTPTPTVTTSISTTTSICEPICHWSEWLDVDFPSAGPNQGDFETYQHIRAAGKQVCQHPRDIQCQAENFPELSIQQVGQVVQCDVNVGLVCKNKDQTGKYKMCLNYKIRVLCCVPNPNCQPTTTLPTPSTTMSTSTPVTTYTTSPSSSETTSTTYTSTTSPTPTPTVTTSISTTTSICEPICHWSEWLDVDFPSAGPNQGDFETYQHIRAAGKQVCQHPRDIQCQAENFPELSIQQVGQVVQCDVNVGLVCKNKDQTGKYKMCLNYKIRVLCCVPNPNCQPTTTLPTPSTTMSTSTPVTTYTTSPSSSETTSTTYTSTTSPTPTPTVTTSISTTTSICEPICHWSEWLDVDFPSAGPNQGDFETYQHIRAAGKQVCQHPRDIQCQAENFPELSIQQVGQVVQCDVNVGLVCKNKDQTGKYKMCLNYKIRVLCCVPNPNCQPTTTLPTPSTTMSTSTPVTTYTTSPSSSETTSTTYTSTTSPTPTPTVTTSISTTTSICEPICHWSEWLDVDFPSAGPNQGDFETYQHIRAAGKQVCQHPRDIQCQAENFPELSIQQVGQVVQCDVNVGLVCKNKDQTGKYKMCLNYKIRVLCCVPNPNCQPTTTLPTPSTTMSTSTPVTTYTTSPSSSETTSTTYTSTTSPTPTPTVTTSISTTTSICEPICHWSEWLDVDFPSAGPNQGDFETYQHIRAAGKQVCQHPRDIQCQAENFPELSIQQVGQVVQCDVNVGLVCKNKDQTGKYKMCLNYKIRVLCCVPNPNCQPTTTLPTPSTTMSTSTPVTTYTTSPSSSETTSTTYTSTTSPTPTPTVTTSISTTTSICEPICHWSEWLDVDFPSAGPNQGDFETYQHIRAAGKQVCQHPRDIQCQAENFPELSIQQVGQVVQCDVNVGLVCKNKDQTGKYKMCLNYKIRVLCCVPNPNCQPTTTLPTPSTTMSTSTPVTTYTTSPSSSETTSTTYTSTTSPTPTPTVTTSISTTTSICEPICHWSEWLDVDFPSAGPNQGDFETYQHIRAAGKQVCQHPRDIQCQAENFPELSIQQVGQVVQCDVNVGLVCKNKDQTGKYKMCLNYKIRVLCCVPNPNCPPTTTLPTPSSVTTITTTSVSTHCFCKVGDAIYSPGDLIYEKMDSVGCRFYAICSKTCRIERFTGDCNVTTPITTTSSEWSTVTTSTPVPTTTPPFHGCVSSTYPPLQPGQRFKLSNCTELLCKGDNNVEIIPTHCPPVKEITCANKYPAVLVPDENGCCYHYECQCVCSGWGDPHYITFDGTYYTFLENCTYVLVKQIVPKYDNFRVYIDNYYCDAKDGLSCPKSIIIFYKSAKVVLTRELMNGVMTNVMYYNHKIVKPGFKKDGISFSTLGINMIVEIPEIGATITFSGLIFSVKLPYSKFGNNTEGQCGTCTNNKLDECRLPSGKIISSCPQMAHHWIVDDNKTCHGVPVPPVVTTPPPKPQCETPPLCKLIWSKIFAPCHAVIPPEPFFKGCVFDGCRIIEEHMQCSSLEIYATECAARGVCIDWRGQTNNTCPYNCPAHMPYKPCGPINPPTCDQSIVELPGYGVTEGCFCPEGTTLMSKANNVCVSECFCRGANGLTRLPGEQWTEDCQECVCDKHTLQVHCTKHRCPLPQQVFCDEPGSMPVHVQIPGDPCCTRTECYCNTSLCPVINPPCLEGQEVVTIVQPGRCCPIYECRQGCVVNETYYAPGAVVPSGPCEECTCSESSYSHPTVKCERVICDTYCPEGYKYTMEPGQCCGTCKATACIMTVEGNRTHVLHVGEFWNPPGNNCITYICEKHNDQYIQVVKQKSCPAFNPDECDPDDIELSEDGCCKVCRPLPKSCRKHNTTSVIKYHGCVSPVPVELTYCKGSCDGYSRYSVEANTMEHKCSCCQEIKTSQRKVTLTCSDGTFLEHSYTYVEQCNCVNADCIPQGSNQQETQQIKSSQEQVKG